MDNLQIVMILYGTGAICISLQIMLINRFVGKLASRVMALETYNSLKRSHKELNN